MSKVCPHCAAQLPEGAAFCPNCAKSVNERTTPTPPRHMPRRTLYSVLLIVLAAAVILAGIWWRNSRPQTYESGTGEVLYDGYHIFLSRVDSFGPAGEVERRALVNDSYRDAVPMYVTPQDDDTLLTDEFMENVASAAVEVNCPDAYLTMTCSEVQQHNEFYPDAAGMVFVDYSIAERGEHTAELVWTVTMKNGDTIRLTQRRQVTSVSVYRYTAQDAPMDTAEELQALVDRVSGEIGDYDQLYLYLPAVTYEGGLTLSRSVYLYGSVDSDGQRTTFTGPVTVAGPTGVAYFVNTAFQGGGQGAGVLAHGSGTRLQLASCQISGWETGLLATEGAWINASETRFGDNGVAICFDITDTPLVSNTEYADNVFENNGTAVLIGQIPQDTVLKFPGSRFTGNGVDIDNRCGQSVDISKAIFE